MTVYRNITANLLAPTSKLDRCAVVVLTELTAHTGVPVGTADLDLAIAAAGEDPAYKLRAIKALRNMGYAIASHKGRHRSWHKLDASPTEYEDHRQALVSEAYSRTVTLCRELAGAVLSMPLDPSLAASHNHAQVLAIALGTDAAIGKSIPEVVAELAPL